MERLNKTAIVVLGNQLFKGSPALKKYPDAEVVMIEADNIFSKRNYHKHKLMLVMLGMRNYAAFLKENKTRVFYVAYKKGNHFVSELEKYIKKNNIHNSVEINSNDVYNICKYINTETIEKFINKIKLDNNIININN